MANDYLKVIVALLVIIVMSFIFLNVVIPANEETTHSEENVNTGPSEVTIHPTAEAGKGIQTIKDDNQGYIAMITDENGQAYYFVNRSTVLLWHNHTNGNYSAPFKVIYYNGNINGDNNSRIISKIL